ncbi:MAG: SpoIIE family protein phosphatase [Chloroflexota bacterium]
MEKILTILIVDDQPYNVDYLEQELADLGYQTVSAPNGKAALERVEECNPDMILLDIMMPEMDGFEVLEKLKADPQNRDIPVVVISAMSDIDNVVKGIELGAEDYLPKPFDPIILQARLRAGLEKKQLKDIEKDYLKALEREFEIGKEMQAGFLPNELPEYEGWQIAARFEPARSVAGDFYDVFNLNEEGKIGIILGDVCDKGVGAALYMTLFRSLLRAVFGVSEDDQKIGYDQKIVDVIGFVNRYICEIHNSASFATLFFGVLDTENGELVYVCAGHDPPMIVNHKNQIGYINPTGPLVGMIDTAEYQSSQMDLNEGDTLYLYSDGLLDSQNIKLEQFGKSRLENILTGDSKTLKERVNILFQKVDEFVGDAKQFDDLTLVAIERIYPVG